jgi:hypothetical protein
VWRPVGLDMRSAIVLALLAAVVLPGSARADAEHPPKKRIVTVPEIDATITLRFDDSVIVPAPPVKPLVALVPIPHAFGDARPYPHGILLVEPPAPRRVIAVFREVPDPAIDDARGNALVDLGVGLGALALAAGLAGRRRTATHPVGML